ncbi:MAG: hypothetical protein SVM86_01260 [Candidatus Cloacimonadota bacterium]|nr:hypothetical protein [Candidatus Cloacimonadota bacterium]
MKKNDNNFEIACCCHGAKTIDVVAVINDLSLNTTNYNEADAIDVNYKDSPAATVYVTGQAKQMLMLTMIHSSGCGMPLKLFKKVWIGSLLQI